MPLEGKTRKKSLQSKNNSSFESENAKMNSPRPTPFFYIKEQTFSTKKERQFPREQPPPTPRVRTSLKSCPALSRVFSHSVPDRPQSVSFMNSQPQLSTKFYDSNSNKLYFNQCFEIISKLGSGSFGEVFKVTCKEDGMFYAVKRSKERFRGKFDRLQKLEEVKKHEQLPKHPNCVQFFKAWEECDHLYIQTELCKTSLSQYSEENHDIPESTVWNFLVDLLLAVKHLHDHNFIHLDIKPENIFIAENGICKLGDFGLVLDVTKGNMKDALEGDPKYLAPELMSGVFTKAADIFSLGITILELACDLDLPRGDTTWHQLRKKQIPVEFTKRLSPSLTEVICRMMEPDHKIRPSIDDILNFGSVRKAHKRRLLVLRIKSIGLRLKGFFNWAFFPCYWIRSCFSKIFSFGCRTEEKVTTPVRQSANLHPSLLDYSFCDEDVFESEGSSNKLSDVCSALFKNDVEYLDDSNDEDVFSRSPTYSRKRKAFATAPPLLRHRDDDLQLSPVSPSFRNKSSPKSVRRSPRFAAKTDADDVAQIVNIAPRNLLAEFDKVAANDL